MSDHQSISAQTYELAQAKIKLRSNLKFTLHQNATSRWYLVEDVAQAKYFRVGVAEYAFLSLLNGTRTLEEAMARLASMSCCDDIDEHKAANLAKWIINSGLADTSSSLAKDRVQEQHEKERTSKMMQWMNPISFRLPLFNPDQILGKIYSLIKPLCGFPILFVWMAVCFWGLITLLQYGGEFWTNQVMALTSFDILWIGLTWAVLKVAHEVAHGVMCKHFGGEVNQCGILLLLFIPLPYVDVSSSWRFTDRTKRILVAAAGILAELFIASIAFCWWVGCDPGPLKYQLGNLFIAATIHTLLFNVNPLMKFDGYYILADWLSIPNLYTRGMGFVKSLSKKIFFGVNTTLQEEPDRKRTWIVRIYGVCAVCWFALICISLSVAAIGLLHGFGALIAAAGAVLWIGLPLFKLAKYVIMPQETENRSRLRFACVASGLAVALIAGLSLIPSPNSIGAPFVIEYDQVAVVRAKSPGFVEQFHVRPGDTVKKGDVLASLFNPDLILEITRLESDISVSKLRREIYHNDEDLASWQLENETLDGLQKQLSEMAQRKIDLVIRAPRSGVVMAEKLEELVGQYVYDGTDLFSIGNPESKNAIAMVRQPDAVWLRKNQGENATAKLQIWGTTGGDLSGQIATISPRATDKIPHFSFASVNRGPLTVVSRSQVEESGPVASSLTQGKLESSLEVTGSQSRAQAEQTGDLKLVDQYVPVEIKFSAEESRKVRVGQTGRMTTGGRCASLGEYLYSNCAQWVSANVRLTHGL